jgi:ABC-2 type transport system ATP-binding protein
MEIISIQQLTKSYGKKVVLTDLNMNLSQGEIAALVGINGSGKSTLIEIVCGIKKANSGQIQFFGQSIQNFRQRMTIKKSIGYMPQHFCLFNDLTVRENLSYMASIYELQDKDIVKKTLEQCYLSEVADYLAKNLSGGYRQLLSLAAAIIHNPKLLILDEPTSAMDPLFRKRFWKIIKEYNKKQSTTVLVTTHYMEEIFECDNIMFLSSCKIIHKNAVSEIFENGKFKTINEVLSYYILKEGEK